MTISRTHFSSNRICWHGGVQSQWVKASKLWRKRSVVGNKKSYRGSRIITQLNSTFFYSFHSVFNSNVRSLLLILPLAASLANELFMISSNSREFSLLLSLHNNNNNNEVRFLIIDVVISLLRYTQCDKKKSKKEASKRNPSNNSSINSN